MIQIENLSFAYGAAGGTPTILQDISLQVGKGRCVALVGPSGCGKSSLLKLMAGLLSSTAGSVAVAGQPVSGPLKIVGMAFQNPALLPWRTTLENVLLPLEVASSRREAYRSDPKPFVRAARELLAAVGLDAFEGHYPRQLSGGMQQRASLCRALVHEPELLLLDEPFAALDIFTREELWGVLQALRERRPFTAVLVTHELREAVFLADAVHVLSPRPARLVASRDVALPRPRTLEGCYEPRFVELVHELRGHIAGARAGAPTRGAGAPPRGAGAAA